MKKVIALGLLVLSAVILAGCVQFNPNQGNQSNNTYNHYVNNNKTLGLAWESTPGAAEKFDKLKSYLEAAFGKNVSLSNLETENKTGIMRANLNIEGQTLEVYLSPDAKHFWFKSNMKELAPGQTVDEFLKNILRPGVTYRLENTFKKYGLEGYNYTLEYQGRVARLQLYKLGNNVILSNAIEEVFSPNQTEKPKVDLYIMAFCPFGRQAASMMYPVEKLLGKLANITVHYVIYPASMYSGHESQFCVGSYCSMHGINETREDMRQLCIEKYYPEKFWDYLNTVSSDLSYNPGNIEDNWKSIAEKLGINTTKIENCVETEGKELLAKEYQLDKEYGVTGSPTLIINGETWKGGRSPSMFQWAICQAFKNKPEECNETINASVSSGSTGMCE